MSLRLSIGLSAVLTVAGVARSEEPPANAEAADSKAAIKSAEVDPAHAEKMQEGLSLFKSQVRKVLIDQCVDCHGGDAVESGFDLATRKGLLRGGAHGPSVVIGKSDDSNVFRFISHRQKPYMPEGGERLPEAQIAAIARWIDLGAPYDRPLVENPRDPDAWTAAVVPDKARDYWAFRPLAAHAPPPVTDESWIRTPIDQFVLAKLEASGLTPNKQAERRALVRRAWFDLVGLPPPADEIARMLGPAADGTVLSDGDWDREYEAMLDRLLASPHYGERWGRHWLDAARFAESHGFEQDYDRPHAYHFRDFVIQALNGDMPYDQFVRWQLAGDELAPEEPLALMATGFLGAGVFPTQITANEVERTRYDALDDMAATTGSALLGLTIGCARCHDHKFDPIPQADYYRFVSTFTTTVRSNIDVDMHPEQTRERLAAWEKEHAPKAAALATFEKDELPTRFAAWLDSDELLGGTWRKETDWFVLDQPAKLASQGGATLAAQDDGSISVTGKNPDNDMFTIVSQPLVAGPRIHALRLEALPDPSLVKSGPGRADNGNFALSRIRVFVDSVAADTGSEGKSRREIRLTQPQADFQQNDNSLSIAASLDDDPKTGWAVDPQFGKRHWATFAIDDSTPLTLSENEQLVFELEFAVNTKHALGRLRLSYSSREGDVKPDGASRPVSLVKALNQIEGVGSTALLSDGDRKVLHDEFRRNDPLWGKLYAEVQASLSAKPRPDFVKVMVCSEGVTPIRHHTQGADFFEETYFLKRGDNEQKMGVAEPGFLQVLSTAPAGPQAWRLAPPPGSKLSYRRSALAAWITDTEHGAGNLLARVIANRLWHHHFGRGIVATPNDFGVQGTPPTHPELLEWLAQELIASQWKLKPLHKQIMLSAAYRQSSQFDEADAKLDPENLWLWRRDPQRLEAEVIRDSMLAASGALDRTPFGPGTLDEAHRRRSIYFQIKRSQLVPMMQLFDQPEPLVSIGSRPSTTIAPQALALLNSPHVRGWAKEFAGRLVPAFEKSPTEAVKLGYQTAIARQPAEGELAAAVAFLESQEKSYVSSGKGDARELALADFCQVLFGLNEFVYID
ncbi:MAG: PSD1 and planctomycete cytochrome C domain-containing protein [Pirellulaceae bacterium]|nr:PSD1 and planctomycete cytochrome C domain-containing protein [Pirellulaceae bacterium]